MTPIILSIFTFLSTLSGGIFALKKQKWIKKVMSFTAGIIIGVVAFDLLPEIFKIISTQNISSTVPMVALVVGFLVFHISEKLLLMHHAEETQYGPHHHPKVGVLSALALSGHSFLDGVGIGLGFQINATVGVAVAIAVIGHDFADGLNTVNLVLINKNKNMKALKLLFLDAIAPILGVLSTRLFHLSEANLVIYLGFFAGFLLYIGASDILPQAHEDGSTKTMIGLTIFGAVFMFVVTRFA